jgi:hypothetical protein
MKTKLKPLSPTDSISKKSFWIFILPIFGLVGLYLTAQQIYPHVVASYWKQQLADAPPERVEIILGQIAELGNAGIPALVEAFASDREPVALAAKHLLLDRMERWKSLSEEEYSSRLLFLADSLATQAKAFGPAARSDASELATEILLGLPKTENPSTRALLLAACDEVLQSTTAVQGESALMTQVHTTASRQSEADLTTNRSVAWELGNTKKTAAMHFEPLPGGGLPIAKPAETQKSDYVLPGEIRDIPPAYFQEPSGTRSLDFSNQTANPLHVPETSPQNTRKNPPPGEDRQIKSMSLEVPKVSGDSRLQMRDTLDLMRLLGNANEGQADELRAELRRRGLSAIELELAAKLFDPDPAVRKQLIAELPSIAEIDASAWLLQCCKDEDADVRLASFSLLATSSNPLLLQKLKVLAQNDTDTRIQHLADQIHEDRKK